MVPFLHLVLVVVFTIFPIRTSQSWDNSRPLTILYNGSLTSHFSHPPHAPMHCGDYFSQPELSAYLEVGVNPPWDNNPFFFQLYDRSENGEGYYTNTPVYNLHFFTAVYVCYQPSGQTCSTVLQSWPYYFVPIEMVNLNRAVVERTIMGPEIGYSVSGDEKTWVSNDTTICEFEYNLPKNYTKSSGCMAGQQFVWNSSFPFTYNLSFSNTTASATFFLNTRSGSMTLKFHGNREIVPSTSSEQLSLNISDSHKPTFTFTNGTTIKFHNDSRYNWWVTASVGSAIQHSNGWAILWVWMLLAFLV